MTLAAIAQLTSGGAILENLATSSSLIRRAAAAGAKAIFLPEATDFIAPATSVPSLSRSEDNAAFVRGIREAARQSRIWVSVGVHEPPSSKQWEEAAAASSSSSSSSAAAAAVESSEKTGEDEGNGRCFNTQLLIDDEGEVRARYRKLHLFDVDIQGGLKILESGTTIPGNVVGEPIPTPLGSIGLQTCYDVRFPEPSLSLRRQGAQILTYPSAFTTRTGAAHWEALLRARAIENQCYVFAAAQVGDHPGTKRTSWGHALAVDPYGSIVAQCSDMQPYKSTFCLADVDLPALERMRQEMPLWSQRRPDAYPVL